MIFFRGLLEKFAQAVKIVSMYGKLSYLGFVDPLRSFLHSGNPKRFKFK